MNSVKQESQIMATTNEDFIGRSTESISSQEQKFQNKTVKFDIPSKCAIKSFEEDHFFNSIAAGLNHVREKLQINSKQLRTKCKEYVTAQLKNCSSKSHITTLLHRRTKYNTIKEYVTTVEYTADECECLGIDEQVLGQYDVEGHFFCELFNIKIHVVDCMDKNQWRHQLVKKESIENIDARKISYKDTNLIHLIKMGGNVYQLALQTKVKEIRATNGANNFDNKRSGTIDWGRLYEEGILAHIAIQCALNEEVEDFELFNNVDGLGAFDDVVLKVKYGGGKDKELYVFQVKHKENKHVNVSNVFENKNDIFYVPKYQESFDQISNLYESSLNLEMFKNIKKENIKFILFSNIVFDTKKDIIVSKQYLFSKKMNCVNIMNTFSTKEGVYPYKIIHKNLHQNTEFLSKCYIYANQIEAKQIEDVINKNLNNNIHPDKTKLILNCFATWTRQKRNEKIVKIDMINLIIKNCLPHYDVFTTENSNIKNADIILKMLNDDCFFPFVDKINLKFLKQLLIRKIQAYFDIEIFADLWHRKIDHETIKEKSEICEVLSKQNMFLTNITHNDLFYLLWEIKKLPMLVEFTDKTAKCIEFIMEKFEKYLKTKSFVLIYQENSPTINNENVNKINNFDVLKNVTLSFQGKELTNLQGLINNDEKVLKTITPNVLLTLLINSTTIGEKPELIPYYIRRKISLPILKDSVFTETKHLFILNEKNNLHIEEYVNEYEKTKRNSNKFKYKHVNKLHSDLSVENSLQLLRDIKGKSKHFLIKEDVVYYLIQSSGSINNLRNHLLIKKIINEEDVLRCWKSPVNICSNTAGMGKTCLLQSIASCASAEDWTIYLNLNEHIHKLDSFNYSENIENIIDYLIDFQVKESDNCIKKFLKALLLARAKSKHLTLLLDGYDEVIFKQIKQFTKWALKFNMKIWITTRPSKIVELENSLGIFSLKMRHFDHEDQLEFLKQFYQESKMDEDDISKIIEKVEPYCKSFDGAFIGIPLQTKLLAEVLIDVSEEELKEVELDLVYLYKEFLKKKIVELAEHKQDAYKTFCKKLSLTLFFGEEILEECGLDLDDLNAKIKEFKQDNKKDFIISGFTNKNTPMFVHRTYAEFLAVQYLFEQLIRRTKEKWKPLLEKLFHMEMTDVRYFLDRLATKNCKLHRAVLNNDLEMVKKCINESKQTDELGRTALELSSSYGKRFDLDTKDDIKGLVNIEKHVEIQFGKWEKQYAFKDWTGNKIIVPLLEQKFTIDVEILKVLLNSNNSNNTSSSYAINTGSLEMLECFSTIQINDLSPRKKKILLYYCTVYNFINIFNNVLFVKESLNELYNETILTHIASSKGNYKICAALYERGAKTVDNDGNTMLHIAVKHEQLNFIDMLLNNHKELNETIDQVDDDDFDGMTPLHLAIQRNYLDIVDILLKKGANANIKTNRGQTVMHLACKLDSKLVERLLQLDGIDINSINEQDDDGWTALHHAAERNKLDVVNLLLSNKANPNIKTEMGQHVLHLICSIMDDTKIIERLLQHDGIHVNSRNDQNGWTALHYSVYRNKLNVVNLLLSNKADLNIKTKKGQHVLHLACLSEYGIDIKIIERLLVYDVISINDQDDVGWTALHYAVDRNKLDVVNLLLSNKANPSIKTKHGQHVLHLACLKADVKIIERLLQHDGIDLDFINDQDDNGWTVLHYTVQQNMLDIVHLLLSKKADPNIKTKKGQHVLHLACSKKDSVDTKTDECLIQHDQIYPIYDQINWTGLHYKADRIKLKMVELLLQHNGSDFLNDQDYDGWTTLHYAVQQNMLDVVNLLLFSKANPNIKTKKRQHVLHLACLKKEGVDIKIIERLLHDGINFINDQDDDGWTALHYSVIQNELDVVILLLCNKANTNIKTKRRQHVLHLACSREAGINTKMVERLLQNDINDINDKDANGCTALHYTIPQNNLDVVNLLLSNKANVNLKTKRRQNALHLACSNYFTNSTIVERLLQHIDINSINDQDDDGWTALHYCIDQNKLDVVNLLIFNKADVNIKTKNKQNLLHLACSSADIKMVKYLLQQDGIDLNSINSQDDDGWTPLHYAVDRNKLDLVKLLLSNEADSNIKTKKRQHILQLACSRKDGINTKMVELLLLHDVISINDQDDDGWTALHYTIQQNNLDVVNLLLSQKANPNIEIKKGQHILHLACSTKEDIDIKIVERLLQHDEININYINDQNGWTALHYAVDRNKLDVVNLLLSKKADSNIKTKMRQHVLHIACSSYYTGKQMVESLLQYDDDFINDQDANGWTPLHWAVFKKNLNVINLLHLKGADFNKLDGDGNTILHIAIKSISTWNNPIPAVKRILAINHKLKYVQNENGQTPLQIVQENKSKDPYYYRNFNPSFIEDDYFENLINILK